MSAGEQPPASAASGPHAFRLDEWEQPVGLPLPDWTPREPVWPTVLHGRYCRLEAWNRAAHAQQLFEALHSGAPADVQRRWTYLPVGPFSTSTALADWLDTFGSSPGTWVMVIIVPDEVDRVVGTASYLRENGANGTVEVGAIVYSPALQRTRAATEAMWLMAHHAVVECGYRRYEWKCDALNAPSRAAATRLGFAFEGVWRNAVVTKGRNRDTAWFAMTDADVQRLSPAYRAWLDPANFDQDGVQLSSLSARAAD